MDNIVSLFHIGDVAEYQRMVGILSDIHHTDYHFKGSHKVDNVYAEVLSGKYDVILLDYHWQSEVSARDILVSARSQSCDTPIIVMTDNIEAEVDREAIRLGASDYLIKGRIDSQLIERTIRYAIERKNAERKLARLAHFDALTNIPNRILFRDRLQQTLNLAERGRRNFALLFIDLDGFKLINDKYGHDIGDLLLQSCAQRLCKCIRKSDTVARIGGDEFTVLLEHTDSTSNIVRIAKKIARAIKQPHSLKNHEVFVGCSIGIAVYPNAGNSVENLQKHADIAMYEAKQSPTEDFRFFTEAMNREVSQQTQLLNDLVKAVEQHSFDIRYQPVMDLHTTQLTAFKIHTRWRHDNSNNSKWIEGEALMDLADEGGLSGALGYWTIHKIMEHAAELAQLPTIDLIVPVALRQLYDNQFIEHINAQNTILQQTHIRLVLEISETTLNHHHELVRSFMAAVKLPQITFALSHFGLGQISVELLHDLPFSQVILAPELCELFAYGCNREIMVAVTTMAKSLNKIVIAEDINTKQQYTSIKQVNCHLGQGEFFSDALDWPQVVECYIDKETISVNTNATLAARILEH